MKSLKQQGFTLIELMVSLALGLVIMLAATQLFITNQVSFVLQRSMGDVQENGRFALDYIALNTRSAEYNGQLGESALSGIIAKTSDSPAAAGLISCNDCISLGIGNSDQLVVRQAVGSFVTDFRDCEGNLVPQATAGKVRYVMSRYFVRADTTSNSTAALACDAGHYESGDAAVTGFGGDGIVLLSSVDSFQIQYGIADVAATALPGTRFPVRYVNATTYNALAGTPPVISAIRVAILVSSSDKVSEQFGTPADIKVLDTTITGSDLADKRVHRLFSSTLALRNAI